MVMLGNPEAIVVSYNQETRTLNDPALVAAPEPCARCCEIGGGVGDYGDPEGWTCGDLIACYHRLYEQRRIAGLEDDD